MNTNRCVDERGLVDVVLATVESICVTSSDHARAVQIPIACRGMPWQAFQGCVPRLATVRPSRGGGGGVAREKARAESDTDEADNRWRQCGF